MLSKRETRYHKQKLIGGNLLKNVYDKVRNVISSGSKILNRIPTGVKTEIKKLVTGAIPKTEIKNLIIPKTDIEKIVPNEIKKLNDKSRAILSNLIAGSGFKNYMS